MSRQVRLRRAVISCAERMPELGLVFWNRLGQGGYERRKQVNAFDTSAHLESSRARGSVSLRPMADYCDAVC